MRVFHGLALFDIKNLWCKIFGIQQNTFQFLLLEKFIFNKWLNQFLKTQSDVTSSRAIKRFIRLATCQSFVLLFYLRSVFILIGDVIQQIHYRDRTSDKKLKRRPVYYQIADFTRLI